MRRLKEKGRELENRLAREIASVVLANAQEFTGGREQREGIPLAVVRRTA